MSFSKLVSFFTVFFFSCGTILTPAYAAGDTLSLYEVPGQEPTLAVPVSEVEIEADSSIQSAVNQALGNVLSLTLPETTTLTQAEDTEPPKPPVGQSAFLIAGGAEVTSDRIPELTINIEDNVSARSEIEVSYSADGIQFTDFYPLQSPYGITYDDVDGVKTLYAKFRDAAGNVSQVYEDSILYDTQTPTGTVQINGGDASTTLLNVSLAISAEDSGSGVTEMRIGVSNKENGSYFFEWTDWVPYAESFDATLIPLPLNQSKEIRVQFRDAAGNNSGFYSDSIFLAADLSSGAFEYKEPGFYELTLGQDFDSLLSRLMPPSVAGGFSAGELIGVEFEALFRYIGESIADFYDFLIALPTHHAFQEHWKNFSAVGLDLIAGLASPVKEDDIEGIGLGQDSSDIQRLNDAFLPLFKENLSSYIAAMHEVGRHQGSLMVDVQAIRSEINNTSYVENVVLHEIAHRWLAYLGTGETSSNDSLGILGRDDGHWSWFFDAELSPLEGMNWRDNGNGTFTLTHFLGVKTSDMTRTNPSVTSVFNDFDLYAMGLLDPDEVTPSFVIDNPTGFSGQALNDDNFFDFILAQGADFFFGPNAWTVQGTRRDITIEDVIAAEGPRSPAAELAQTEFNAALFVVKDQTPSSFQLSRVQSDANYLVDNLNTIWSRATRGLSTMKVGPADNAYAELLQTASDAFDLMVSESVQGGNGDPLQTQLGQSNLETLTSLDATLSEIESTLANLLVLAETDPDVLTFLGERPTQIAGLRTQLDTFQSSIESGLQESSNAGNFVESKKESLLALLAGVSATGFLPAGFGSASDAIVQEVLDYFDNPSKSLQEANNGFGSEKSTVETLLNDLEAFFSGPIEIPDLGLPTGSMSFPAGLYTNSQSLKIDFTGLGDAKSSVLAATYSIDSVAQGNVPGFLGAEGEQSVFIPLPDEDKTYKIEITLLDESANSITLRENITLDRTPAGASFFINEGALTQESLVRITLNVDEVYTGTAPVIELSPEAEAQLFSEELGLSLYNGNDFFNVWGYGDRWLLSSNKDPRGAGWYFILPDGRVYRYGNLGGDLLSGSELIKTLDPTIYNQFGILHGAIKVEIPAADAATVKVEYAVNGDPKSLVSTFNAELQEQLFAIELPSTSGTYQIELFLTDQAGNVNRLTRSIVLDRVAPVANFVINGGASQTETQQVSLDLSQVSDEHSSVASVEISLDGGNAFSSVDFAGLPEDKLLQVSLPDGDGNKPIHLRVTDAAGNQSVTTQSILLETPEQAIPVINSLTSNAIDRSGDAGTQVYATDTLTFSGAASDADSDVLSWTWIYQVNGGSEVTFSSGSGTIQDAIFSLSGSSVGDVYVWSLRVSDGSATVEQSINFEVIAVPDTTAPVITGPSISGVSQTGAVVSWTTNEGSTSQVEVCDGSGNNCSLTTLDTNLVTSHQVTLTGLSAGTTYQVRVRSEDGSGNESISSFVSFTTTSVIIIVNEDPVLNPVGNKTVDEESLLSFTVSGSDPEGVSVSYLSSTLPSGASFNTATGFFEWMPSLTQSGTYEITFSVSDGVNVVSETITITVQNVEPEVSDPVGDPTLAEKAYALDQEKGFMFTGNYYQNVFGYNEKWFYSTGESAWYVVLPNGEVHKYNVASVHFDDSTKMETLDESYWDDPSKLYEAPVPSGGGVTPNRDPVIDSLTSNAIDRSGDAGTQVYATDTLTFSGAASDADSDVLSWAWVYQVNGGSEVTFSSGSGTIQDAIFSLSGSSVGDVYVWSLRVSDGSATVEQSVNFEVIAVSDTTAPVITGPSISGVSQTGAVVSWTTDEGSTSQVEVCDRNGNNCSLTTLDTNLETSHQVTLTGLSAGTAYQVRVRSEDGAGNESISSFTSFTTTSVIIIVNEDPVLNPVGNKTVDEESLLSFTVSGSDPEGVSVSYLSSTLPSGASFNTATGFFEWMPSLTQSGTYEITFSVSDGVNVVSETITITVQNVEPEVSDPVGDPTLAEKAYTLDQEKGFMFTGNYYQNVFGYNEKWFYSTGESAWYVVLPNGEVHKYNVATLIFDESTKVDTLDSTYWDDPSKLYEAPVPA